MEAGRSRFRWRVATAAAVLLVALAIWILRWLPSSSLSSQAAEDAAVKLREDNAASLSSNQDRIQPAEAISCIDTEGQMVSGAVAFVCGDNSRVGSKAGQAISDADGK